MKETILSITIKRNKDGSFSDEIRCSGTEVEVLGMIEKTRMFLDDIKINIIRELKEKKENKS
jgi:hypothetical protein